MSPEPTDTLRPGAGRKRRLRAVFAADIANFSGRVSVSETRAFSNLSAILKVGREELARHEGELIGMPGDGLFALFESAVDCVHCALAVQERLSVHGNLGGMRLRIGIHLGEVLFDEGLPFGETLNIAARLESLADPGGILVSAAVVDAVSARVAATFEDRGVPRLKNIPRRIATFSVKPADTGPPPGAARQEEELLDHTMRFSRHLGSSPRAPAAPASPPDGSETAPAASRAAEEPGPLPAAASAIPEPVVTTSSTAEQQAAAPPAKPAQPKRSEAPPTPEALALLVEALAVHLGPVARVLVARKAKDAATLNELVAALEGEIPLPQERIAFRSRLHHLLGR